MNLFEKFRQGRIDTRERELHEWLTKHEPEYRRTKERLAGAEAKRDQQLAFDRMVMLVDGCESSSEAPILLGRLKEVIAKLRLPMEMVRLYESKQESYEKMRQLATEAQAEGRVAI